MADRQVASGKSMGPIIELEDGVQILAQVVDIRPTTGEYEGHLIDMIAPDGSAFSINGHKILLDKIREYWIDEPMPFDIKRDGMVGRAIKYDVYRVTAKWSEILIDPAELKLCQSTCTYVATQFASQPPTD